MEGRREVLLLHPACAEVLVGGVEFWWGLGGRQFECPVKSLILGSFKYPSLCCGCL